MKTLILAAVRCSLMFTAVTGSLVCVQPAQAYTVTLRQVGSNVVANGSGAVNLTGLTLVGSGDGLLAEIISKRGVIEMGPAVSGSLDQYRGFSGPTSFESGGPIGAGNGSGDFVGIRNDTLSGLFVPAGYVSNTNLTSSATWNNATFASLGLTPGTYAWTWGTGLPNQNFTLIIGGAGVPDGGTTVSLLGFALFGLTALRCKLGC
jgi:hypothetical protein